MNLKKLSNKNKIWVCTAVNKAVIGILVFF